MVFICAFVVYMKRRKGKWMRGGGRQEVGKCKKEIVVLIIDLEGFCFFVSRFILVDFVEYLSHLAS